MADPQATIPQVTIEVHGPDAAAVAAQLSGAPLVEAPVPQLSDRIEALRAAAGDLGPILGDWAAAMKPFGPDGLWALLWLGPLCLLAAWGIERAAAAGLGALRRGPAAERSAIASAVAFALGMAGRLAVFAIATQLLMGAAFAAGSAAAALAPALLAAALRARALLALVEVLAAPGAPHRRPVALNEPDAARIARAALPVALILGALSPVRIVLDEAIGAGAAGAVPILIARGAELAAAFWFFVAVRRPAAGLLARGFGAEGRARGIAARLCANWHVFYGALLLLTWAAEASARLNAALPGMQDAGAAAAWSFQVFLLAPFALGWIASRRRAEMAKPPECRSAGRIAGWALAEGGALIAAALILLYAWNIDPFDADPAGAARFIPKLVSAALALAIGVALWRLVRALLDLHLPAAAAEEDAPTEGEGGRAGDRMETLRPVLRGAALAAVGALSLMLALSALGVEIGPLLAAAGVLGVAFGFGAQTLVEDVISGMFYLAEDAFRVGEYIETAEGNGVVEKILLRSVRLRHPRGAVTTVAFSAMGTVQNHSRDWTTVKFSFLVGQDEDLEKIRKLVKKTGAKLAADPELEGQFLEPLKSQGALAMQGPNYEIGVKFTCRPGEQFLIRRKAYAAIQKALREAGVQVATPRVRVDQPGDALAAAAAFGGLPTAGAPQG